MCISVWICILSMRCLFLLHVLCQLFFHLRQLKNLSCCLMQVSMSNFSQCEHTVAHVHANVMRLSIVHRNLSCLGFVFNFFTAFAAMPPTPSAECRFVSVSLQNFKYWHRYACLLQKKESVERKPLKQLGSTITLIGSTSECVCDARVCAAAACVMRACGGPEIKWFCVSCLF